MAQPSNHQHVYPANHQPGHPPRRVLTRLLCVLLALQPMLAQAAPVLAQSVTFTAPAGQVSLLAKTDTDYVQKRRREADLLWWNERDQGRFKETVRPVEIEAGGGLRINAGRGVVIEYHQTGDLRASLGQLAEAPGLGWIASLQADPRVDWRGVEAAFREWDYEQSGLTEAGAALVALATAAATWGVSAKLSAALTKTLPSAMQGAAMSTALTAGARTLFMQAGVTLANNKGDIAATLKQLASTDTLRSLATAMVTAGLTAHLEQAAGLGGELTRTAQYMERGLIRATVRAGVGTALQGGSLDEHFILKRWGFPMRADQRELSLPEPLRMAYYHRIDGLGIANSPVFGIYGWILPFASSNEWKKIDYYLAGLRLKKKFLPLVEEMIPGIKPADNVNKDMAYNFRMFLSSWGSFARKKRSEGDHLFVKNHIQDGVVYYIRDADVANMMILAEPAEAVDRYCEHVLLRKEGRFDFRPWAVPFESPSV